MQIPNIRKLKQGKSAATTTTAPASVPASTSTPAPASAAAITSVTSAQGVPVDTREQAILSSTIAESTSLRESMDKKRFQWKRRTKMPYKIRMMIFAAILAVLMAAYFISFGLGNPIGAYVSMICDNISKLLAEDLFGIIGALMGRDMSEHAIPLQRLLTLGPISFIIFATTLSLVISGIIALVWSRMATKRALDDGTSNFVSEADAEDERQGTIVSKVKGAIGAKKDGRAQVSGAVTQADANAIGNIAKTPEQVYEEAKARYLAQGMNRAQAENAAKQDVTRFKAQAGILDMPVTDEEDTDDLAAIMADERIPVG